MKTKLFTILAALTVIAALSSCQKEKVATTTTTGKKFSAAAKSKQEAYARQTVADLINIAQSVAGGSGISFKKASAFSFYGQCVGITNDTVSNPHTCTLDFGVLGCTGNDGKTRSGQIIISYPSDQIKTPGVYFDVTPNGFAVDQNQVSGTLHVLNTGANGSGNLEYSMNTPGGVSVVMADGSGTLLVTYNQVGEWIAGSGTVTNDDDVYGFRGVSYGHLADGSVTYDTIYSQLVKNLDPNCTHNFIQGQELIQIQGNPDKLVDFGDGTCNAVATQTVNGTTSPYVPASSPF